MATVTFLLQSTINPANIYVRLSINRKTIFKRKTGYVINPTYWSKETGLPNQKEVEVKQLRIDLKKLSTEIENPNSANVLFLCNGTILGGEGDYDLVCDLFDGRFDDTKAAARERYVAYREKGYSLTYWQQTETGWTNQNGR